MQSLSVESENSARGKRTELTFETFEAKRRCVQGDFDLGYRVDSPSSTSGRHNLLTKGFNDSFGGSRPGKVLLPGNQVSVSHRKSAPQPRLDVVRPYLLHAMRHRVTS